MLDNFISCPGFFKRISDCKVTTLGVRSDHATIRVKFRLTAIKFNIEQDNIEIIDWKIIQTDHDAKDELMTDYLTMTSYLGNHTLLQVTPSSTLTFY